MRRLSIVLSLAVAGMALLTAPAAARGPEKNDSVNGHGVVVVPLSPVTLEFKVSAHTISSFTTAATGNMYLEIFGFDEFTGLTTHTQLWADVFCVAVLGITGEVRGHIYRAEPDFITAPTDLVFDVVDTYPLTPGPDYFEPATEIAPSDCSVADAAFPLAKGQITVNDEL